MASAAKIVGEHSSLSIHFYNRKLGKLRIYLIIRLRMAATIRLLALRGSESGVPLLVALGGVALPPPRPPRRILGHPHHQLPILQPKHT